MKHIRPIIALAAAFLSLNGCTQEDYGFCPDEIDPPEFNVTIAYRLPGKNNECEFRSKISAVDLFLFDEKGDYVATQRTEDKEHTGYQGTRLNLKPGSYSIVAWANMSALTECRGLADEQPHGYGPHIAYTELTGEAAGRIDPLFYAPKEGRFSRAGNFSALPGCHTVIVDPETGYDGTVDFTPAHRTVKVYVQGYADGGDNLPIIQLSGLPEGLGLFGMETLRDENGDPRCSDSEQKAGFEEKEGIRYAMSHFQTFWFSPEASDVMLRIIHPESGEVLYSIPLKEAIGQSGDEIEVAIEIVIRFVNGVVVEVGVPQWNTKPLEPGLEED